MKSRAVLLIAILLLLTGAVLLYLNVDKLNLNQKTSILELVPENAVMVFESPDLINKWNEFLNTSMWSNLKTQANFQSIQSTLEELDEITGSSGVLDNLARSRGFLLSTHIISNDQYDHVRYLDLNDKSNQDLFFDKLRSGFESGSFVQSERVYNNQRIFELSKKKGEPPFLSYLLVDNILVLSGTPYLVEDVIRTYQGDSDGFFSRYATLANVTKLNYDAGNLYLNLREFVKYMKLFFDNSKEDFLFPVSGLQGSAFSDVDFNNNFTFFNGVLQPENQDHFLKIFEGQRARPLSFLPIVPERTSALFYYHFDDAQTFYNNLWQYYSGTAASIAQKHNNFINEGKFDVSRMLTWLNGSVAMLEMESLGGEPDQKVMVMETSDINEALNQFSRFASDINNELEDSLYYEAYANKVISLIEMEDFPLLLFGKGFEDFEMSFYTAIDNYLVISGEIQTIKTLLDDIEDDQTWSKSISKNEFLDFAVEESNVGVFVNMPKMWSSFNKKLSGYWSEKLNSTRDNFLHFEIWSAQFNVVEDAYYSNLIIKHRDFSGPTTAAMAPEIVFETDLGSPVVIKPQIVRNHIDGSREMLVQDSLNYLYLVNSKGDILWQDSLDTSIDSEIVQVDFFANKKLQYLFLNDQKLYIIDRNGVHIDDFPILLEDFVPIGISVVDYDNSKNYRYFFNEANGNVWLTNKKAGPLQGWAPNNFSMSLRDTPKHSRIRGKDVFIIVGKNGELLLTNRKGEYLGDFPIDLDARISGDIFIETKSSFNTSLMQMVTEEGELITVTFDGKVKERKQLFRPSKDAIFELIIEKLGKTFVIRRQDFNTLAILDRSGQTIFEKDYFSNDRMGLQYYNYGSSNELYAVRIPSEKKVYLYDGNGRSLVYPALNCDFPISAMHYESDSRYVIYGASGQTIYAVNIQR